MVLPHTSSAPALGSFPLFLNWTQKVKVILTQLPHSNTFLERNYDADISEQQITQNSQAKSLLARPRRRGGLQQERPCCGKTGGTASASLVPGWHHGRPSGPTPVSGAHARTSRHLECTTKPKTHTHWITVWSRCRNLISQATLTWSVYWELMISPTLILTLSCWKHSRWGEHSIKPRKPPVAARLESCYLPRKSSLSTSLSNSSTFTCSCSDSGFSTT